MPTTADQIMNYVLAGAQALAALQRDDCAGARDILSNLSSELHLEHVEYLLTRIEAD